MHLLRLCGVVVNVYGYPLPYFLFNHHHHTPFWRAQIRRHPWTGSFWELQWHFWAMGPGTAVWSWCTYAQQCTTILPALPSHHQQTDTSHSVQNKKCFNSDHNAKMKPRSQSIQWGHWCRMATANRGYTCAWMFLWQRDKNPASPNETVKAEMHLWINRAKWSAVQPRSKIFTFLYFSPTRVVLVDSHLNCASCAAHSCKDLACKLLHTDGNCATPAFLVT